LKEPHESRTPREQRNETSREGFSKYINTRMQAISIYRDTVYALVRHMGVACSM
jgi:hypothetical protein